MLKHQCPVAATPLQLMMNMAGNPHTPQARMAPWPHELLAVSPSMSIVRGCGSHRQSLDPYPLLPIPRSLLAQRPYSQPDGPADQRPLSRVKLRESDSDVAACWER